jgi:2-C-methyl-D-erythritol 4-phosphate cytidylyltransferase
MIAVVLAGGTGSRVGLSIPKQLIKVAGKAVMEHTIAIFEDSDVVDDIFVLMHPDHLEAAQRIGVKFSKVRQVLAGGATRNDTTRASLQVLSRSFPPDTKVMFHDAVRPLLDQRIIEDVDAALNSGYDAVDVAIASADTIIEVNDRNEIVAVPPRAALRRGQTPQAFRLGVLTRAYERAWKDPNFAATDDCTVVHKYLPDTPIKVVEGAGHNLKITEPIDVFMADKLFQISSAMVGSNPDAYAERLAGKVMVVLGGSYGIGADIAELAMSHGARVHTFSRSQTNTNVENADDVAEAFAQVREQEGRIDYIVVTAGLLSIGKLAEIDLDDALSAIRVNYIAPVLAARAGYQYLRETRGQLLFFTSSSYTRGRADYSIYSSTKAAVVNLTQALADEWSPLGVRVNCINPERTATPMRTKAFGKEPPESLLSSHEVARTSLDVLLSPLTGQVIDVRRLDPGAASASGGIASALQAASEDLGQS